MNVVKLNNIGMSPSGKALDFDSSIRQFKSGHPSQKSESLGFRIFHLCPQDTTSFAYNARNIISP